MEYEQSDIKKVLSQVPDIKIDDNHIVTILYNMLCSINFMHSANIIHRDLKPANFLIN